MKFIKEFAGVPEGEVYPVHYAMGDECPPELEEAALEQDAVDAEADLDVKADIAPAANADADATAKADVKPPADAKK